MSRSQSKFQILGVELAGRLDLLLERSMTLRDTKFPLTVFTSILMLRYEAQSRKQLMLNNISTLVPSRVHVVRGEKKLRAASKQ